MKARVLVSFVEPAQGGRKAPFHGVRYATVARWVRDGHREEWSAVVDFGKPVTGGSEPLQGTLSFLATPPEKLVRKGTQNRTHRGATHGGARPRRGRRLRCAYRGRRRRNLARARTL